MCWEKLQNGPLEYVKYTLMYCGHPAKNYFTTLHNEFNDTQKMQAVQFLSWTPAN